VPLAIGRTHKTAVCIKYLRIKHEGTSSFSILSKCTLCYYFTQAQLVFLELLFLEYLQKLMLMFIFTTRNDKLLRYDTDKIKAHA